jgi:hypothetical protein
VTSKRDLVFGRLTLQQSPESVEGWRKVRRPAILRPYGWIARMCECGGDWQGKDYTHGS